MLQRKDNKIAALEAKVKGLTDGLEKSEKNAEKANKLNKKLQQRLENGVPVQPVRQELAAPASAKRSVASKVEEAAATSGDKVTHAGLPPAAKEKPASTKLAFGAGQNQKHKGDLITGSRKRQTWSDRGSEKSRSPQRSVKKPISSKVAQAPEQ